MKLICAFLFCFIAISGFSRDYGLYIFYSFKGIEDGYDHLNKIKVYVDGQKIAESSEKKESANNYMHVKIPSGQHTIVVENWAYYENEWQLHNKSNGYSLDLVTTKSLYVDGDHSLRLLYDLDGDVKESFK